MPRCSALHCKNSTQEGFYLRRFPLKHPDLLAKWLANIEHESWWKPSSNSCLCQVHFSDSQWIVEDGSKMILKLDAIPDIFLVDQGKLTSTTKKTVTSQNTLEDINQHNLVNKYSNLLNSRDVKKCSETLLDFRKRTGAKKMPRKRRLPLQAKITKQGILKKRTQHNNDNIDASKSVSEESQASFQENTTDNLKHSSDDTTDLSSFVKPFEMVWVEGEPSSCDLIEVNNIKTENDG